MISIITIECIIQESNVTVGSRVYKANVVPRIDERIIYGGSEVFLVTGVVHYSDRPDTVSILVEQK